MEDEGIENTNVTNLLSEEYNCGSDIVTAKVRNNQVALRIDGKASWKDIVSDVKMLFIVYDGLFLGKKLAIEWLDKLPTKEQSVELESLITGEFQVTIDKVNPRKQSVVTSSENTTNVWREKWSKNSGKSELVEVSENSDLIRLEKRDSHVSEYIDKISEMLEQPFDLSDDANCVLHVGTVRSGQRIETAHNLFILGDVNPGADLIAGGNIVVFGTLRGNAHAYAYSDEDINGFILALHFEPLQLRIGSLVYVGNRPVSDVANLASIKNKEIVVNPFSSKGRFEMKAKL